MMSQRQQPSARRDRTGPSPRSGIAAVVLIACLAVVGSARPLWAAPGSLDTSFGNGGLVLTNFAQASEDGAFAAVIQPDGKIVAAGESNANGNFDFALARYNPDGTLDGSFGVAGKVLTNFSQTSEDEAFAVALQSDGKIVLTGSSDSSLALARYNPNGTLDSTFGSGGLVTTTFGNGSFDEAQAVAIQPDGKIVAAGISDTSGSSDFALARYNADGTLDSTFGNGGKVVTDFANGSSDEAFGIVIQPDGKIVVAGVSDAGGNVQFALARYNANGTLDGSFGAAGKVLTNSSPGSDDVGFAVALQTDGRIVVAGMSGSSFALARYGPNGTLDASFGAGGVVTTAFGAVTFDQATALKIQSDGRIVAAGLSNSFFAVARYEANGTLDTTFGTGGKVTTEFGTVGGAQATAIAVQSDGKLVLVGISDANSSHDFALARYVVDSPPGPFLEVHTDGAAFTSGSPFQLDLVVGNSGAATNVDFYFGVLLPPSVGGCASNDPILFFVGGFSNIVVTCLSAPSPNLAPFVRGVPLPAALPLTTVADFLTFVWSDGFPAGAYTFFAALADAGTLNIRVLAIDTVTFSP
jgi:uncharacterized delta-60 repeat protein